MFENLKKKMYLKLKTSSNQNIYLLFYTFVSFQKIHEVGGTFFYSPVLRRQSTEKHRIGECFVQYIYRVSQKEVPLTFKIFSK